MHRCTLCPKVKSIHCNCEPSGAQVSQTISFTTRLGSRACEPTWAHQSSIAEYYGHRPLSQFCGPSRVRDREHRALSSFASAALSERQSPPVNLWWRNRRGINSYGDIAEPLFPICLAAPLFSPIPRSIAETGFEDRERRRRSRTSNPTSWMPRARGLKR